MKMIVAKKEVRDYLTASRIGRFAIYPHLYPMYYRIYLKGDQTELIANDNAICEWCDNNGVNNSAYFHHEKVIKTESGKILGKNKNKDK